MKKRRSKQVNCINKILRKSKSTLITHGYQTRENNDSLLSNVPR